MLQSGAGQGQRAGLGRTGGRVVFLVGIAVLLVGAVMVLSACGGRAADGSGPVVRGDAENTGESATASTGTTDDAAPKISATDNGGGQIGVSWVDSVVVNPLKRLVGYEVQIASSVTGPWAVAGTGCSLADTKSSTSTQCTATGLSGGSYSFRVAAVKKNLLTGDKKTGDFSAGSALLQVVGAPSAPVIGAATATGTTSVRVEFTASVSDGGSPITGYTATSSPGGIVGSVSQGTLNTAPTAKPAIVVENLAPGTAYTFTVTASNASGTSSPSDASGSVSTTAYSLAATGPGGGKVFYVATAPFTSAGSACGSSCYYLEALTADQGSEYWCSSATSLLPGSFGSAIGTGYANTQLIVQGCTTGAGKVARVTSGGYSDWYLPSQDELNTLFGQRTQVGGFGAQGNYWSSTQVNALNAVYRSFRGVTSTPGSFWAKDNIIRVRPVRAF